MQRPGRVIEGKILSNSFGVCLKYIFPPAGITKVILQNGNGLNCGSESLSLKIHQENNNVCYIANQKEISAGDTYNTNNIQGSNCSQATLDLASVGTIRLNYDETTESFCPKFLRIFMDNGQILDAILPPACQTSDGCVEPSDNTIKNGISMKIGM